jgi:hypothetical protein
MFLSKQLLKQKLATSMLQASKMTFVSFKGDSFKDRGKADEKVYFSQQERDVMKKLMRKLDNEAKEAKEGLLGTSSDEGALRKAKNAAQDKAQAAKEAAQEHTKKLKDIFTSHGVKDDEGLMDALKRWKNSK